ncbi:MAG: DUF2971 domain-containing protein [Mesorhizobium sp.]|uniref:DUF2971 domain-containing protein n=1 Tax=Mesorhizobium sp. TaxID=1871066 RepID=UPI000FE67C0F|nr:DUF2971 domain-containing protein [Mesorhizobium sp.]RWC93418.1 MAG: DUF2971 domain-containing protein [Mesorhizobium sp.]
MELAAAIQDEAYELSHNLVKEVEDLKPKQEIFIHYSSLEAFYSIMDTSRLRFTSVKSTNDPSEFSYGREIVARGLKEALDGAAPVERTWIAGCIERLRDQNFRAFVFCMSEAVDDEAEVGELSQWRLYGADGRGIALVIDTSTEARRNQLLRLTSRPRRVMYGDADGLGLVKKEIRGFLDGIPTLSPATRELLAAEPESAAAYLCNRVFWLPSVIKHKAYRHEREVRLIRGDIGEQAGNPLVFYDKSTIRRPAIELPIAEQAGEAPDEYNLSPIARVIIGPSGDQAAIEDSIRFFLEARKWRLTVSRSDIPYRAV